MAERTRYRFDPADRRGLIGGVSAASCFTLAAGAMSGVAVLRTWASASGLLVAGALLALSGAVALWDVGGRPPVLWSSVAAGFLGRRLRSSLRDGPPAASTVVSVLGAPPALQGATARPRPTTGRARPVRRPGRGLPLRGGPTARDRGRRGGSPGTHGLRIEDAPSGPGEDPFGTLIDERAGTWVGVAAVRGRSFALLDPAEKDRRMGAWGAVLAGLARQQSPVVRIQWVQRSLPGDSDGLERYLAEAGTPAPAEVQTSYRDLIAGAGPVTRDHETWLALAVPGRRLRAGGGPAGPAAVLRRELRLLQGQLRQADVSVERLLTATELTAAIRSTNDPVGRRPLNWSRLGPDGAWPLAEDQRWSAHRADGAWHATYWIAEWPRIEVGPDFLAPLLLSAARVTVSVVLGPIPPDRAVREAEAARTAAIADDELRSRTGFLATARRRRQVEGIGRRETELAEGHGFYRFSGYLTVSGATREELTAACSEVEQTASQSLLHLRRLYGQQGEAYTWTLPLTRGLR